MVPQLFIARYLPVRSDRIEPIVNKTLKQGMPVKPHGGIWTSSYIQGVGSGWLYAHFSMFGSYPEYARYFLLHPSASTKLLVIDCYEDLHHAIEKYPYHAGEAIGSPPPMFTYLDYEKVAQDYDGIHLTSNGQSRTRLTIPYNLYGWDCESTLWFNWCFDQCEEISLPAGKLYDIYMKE